MLACEALRWRQKGRVVSVVVQIHIRHFEFYLALAVTLKNIIIEAHDKAPFKIRIASCDIATHVTYSHKAILNQKPPRLLYIGCFD